ncbi:MAG: hypothetical protein JSS83_18130 [Cyanobacteria bacterium SZAS LIN-3]|nr:hypothetical protein [Cyanobacteria bacterium SZAS LIN-3]
MSPPCFAAGTAPSRFFNQSESAQAAQVLNIQGKVERYLAIRGSGDESSEEAVFLRALILRKILRAVLEVRQACNKLDVERAYAYDIMQKEERRERFINQLFNTANFAQLSTFYTLEPFMRLHGQFVTSAVFTTTSGSLNTTISTLSRLHGRIAKASNVAPPKVLSNLVDGRPIDTSGMPPLVTRYLDAAPPGSNLSRREELFAGWLKNYKIDATKQGDLCSINDKKKAAVGLLRSRILLLWSLHTAVQNFDRQLLCLLEQVESPSVEPTLSTSVAFAGDHPGAVEMAKLLKLQPCIEESNRLKQIGDNGEKTSRLELLLLERSLKSALEVQVASDKVDEDLYYNYHVVLSDLLQSRAKWLQKNYDANFLQSGILGIVAGRLYLSRKSYDGDRMFVISGSNGTALTLLAMLQMHGFRRKSDTGPNSLAEILNLHPGDDYRFSPFVSTLLNAPPPGSTDGKSRRELLNEAWKQAKVTTMSLDSGKNLQAVSAMPGHKYDTISVVKNRIVLLHSLKKDLESFQGETLDLLLATE